MQVDLFKNHFLEALDLSAYLDLDLHDVVWIIRFKVVTTLLFSFLVGDVLLMLLWLSLLDLLDLFVLLFLWLLFLWLVLSNFSLSIFIRLVFDLHDKWLWNRFSSFRILSLVNHVTCSEVLLNKVQLDRFNDLHFLHRWTFGIWVSCLFVSVGSRFATVALWLLLRVLSRHRLLLRSVLV